MKPVTVLSLRILAVIFRILALFLAALVCLLLFGTSARYNVVDQVAAFSGIAPFGGNAALLVLTPFGGAIHGDLCILCVLFFVLDWFFLRVSNKVAKKA